MILNNFRNGLEPRPPPNSSVSEIVLNPEPLPPPPPLPLFSLERETTSETELVDNESELYQKLWSSFLPIPHVPSRKQEWSAALS